MDLSIIVASYNTCALLRACLASIYDNTQGISFEVIVIDDCSMDGSPEMVRALFPQARLIVNSQNMRYAKTNNIGLRNAKGRYGLLLNSDVEVQSGAFYTLVNFMDLNLDAAAAGPKLVNSDGSIQHCIRGFPSLMTMIFQSLSLQKIFPKSTIINQYYKTDFDYEKVQPVKSIGTTSFIIRRSTWEAYGMLDERLTLAFVDLAYCYMLGENKQKIYYIPNAVVMHHGGQSINQNGLKEIRRLHQELRKFYDLYLSALDTCLKRGFIRVGIRLRFLFKIIEYEVSSDKSVFRGSGVAKRP
jgi:GT2 family glycosyltransferase